MNRALSLFLLLGIMLLIIPPGSSGGVGLRQIEPQPDTPDALIDVWLRFHETGLCQQIDAVFVFHKDGMEVWSLIEDDRSYQKLLRMLEGVRSLHRIELYSVRPPFEKKSDRSKSPPPSLWENYELRANLGDPLGRGHARMTTESPVSLMRPDDIFLQILSLYAEQTLDRNKRMKRYAADLPALARVAVSRAADPGIGMPAKRICAAHARDLDRYIKGLTANLKQALPRPRERDRHSSRPEKLGSSANAVVERAELISTSAHEIAQRVHSFIYPEDHTVELNELSHPSLLESLARLKKLNEDFLRAMDTRFSRH